MRGNIPTVPSRGPVKAGFLAYLADLFVCVGFPRFYMAESSVIESTAPASVIWTVPPPYPFDEESSSENSGFVALRKTNQAS